MDGELLQVTHCDLGENPQNIIGFLDQVLRPNAGFSIREEYPALFVPGQRGESFVIRRGGKVVSHSAFLLRHFLHPECAFPLGLIGSVATDPEFRNRGFASQTVLQCCQALRARGAAVALLWSDLKDFYEPLGFKLRGTERGFLGTGVKLDGEESIRRFESVRDSEATFILYEQQPWHLNRSLEEHRLLFQVPKAQTFVWDSGSGAQAYVAMNKGLDFANFVHEWAGPTHLVSKLLSFVSHRNQQELRWIAPFFVDPKEFALVSQKHWVGSLAMMKVLDREQLLELYRTYLAAKGIAWNETEDEFVLGSQTWNLRNEEDLLTLIFGMGAETHHPVLPLFLWGFDSI